MKSKTDSSPRQKSINLNKTSKRESGSNSPRRTVQGTPLQRSLTPSRLSKELNEIEGEGLQQLEFYKMKSELLSNQLNQEKEQNEKLNKQCQQLRSLNFDYVKQLNELSSSKLRAAQKIIITAEFFESDNVQQRVKDFLRKLSNSYKVLEKEQGKLVDHCRVMEEDIGQYKLKVIEADLITEQLRKAGQDSIDSLVNTLKEANEKGDQLTQQIKELNFELALRSEKIIQYESTLEEKENQLEEQKQLYDNLVLKYNQTMGQHEEKSTANQKSIYSLQCKCNKLEYDLRLTQGTLQLSGNEIKELDIKMREMSDNQENLSRMSLYSSRRNLTGTFPNVKFK